MQSVQICLPDPLMERLQAIAAAKGHTVEQEVQEVLESHYTSRAIVLDRIQKRWAQMPTTSPDEIVTWRNQGRP